MSAHTPGPWSLSEPSGGWVVVHQKPRDWDGMGYAAVCRLPLSRKGTHFRDVEEANARLIAASPDLLYACMAMIAWDDREQDHAVDFYERMALCRDAFEKARAAIAKATGEQP